MAHIRGQVLAIAVPLGVILAGFAAGAVAAHQLQVRGLWAAALIAPDPARLGSLGRGSERWRRASRRMTWAVLKAVVLAGVSVWAIRAEWAGCNGWASSRPRHCPRRPAMLMLRPASGFGVVMLVLGLADYGLRYMRFEAMLRTTAAGAARGPAGDGRRSLLAGQAAAARPGVARRRSRAARRRQPDPHAEIMA